MRKKRHEKEGTNSKKVSAKAADIFRGIARRAKTRAEKIQTQTSEGRE